jgi:type I restriction enzyme S subunit
MSNGWTERQLGSVSTISYGYTDSAKEDAVGPRFLRITDIQNDRVDWDSVPYCRIGRDGLAKFRLYHGDIVFARTGATTGKSFLVRDPPEAVFASYLIRLRLNNGALLPEMLSLFFQTERYWRSIRAGSTGSAQGGFNASKLASLQVPIPPISEQKRIVRVLNEMFDGLAAARSKAEKNLSESRALIAKVLDDVFGRRKAFWNKTTLGELITRSRGGVNIDSDDYSDAGVPVLTKGDVKPFGVVQHGGKYVPASTVKKEGWPVTRPTDLIVTTRDLKPSAPFLGLVAPVPSDGEYVVSQGATVFTIDEKRIRRNFFVLWSSCTGFREYVRSKRVGSTQVHIRQGDLFSAPVPVPSLSEQETVAVSLESISAEIERLSDSYQRKLAALNELRKSLLHQAFTGKL